MQKAAEELKKQQEREAEEKKKAVESRVPKLQIDGLDKCELLYDDILCFIYVSNSFVTQKSCFFCSNSLEGLRKY